MVLVTKMRKYKALANPFTVIHILERDHWDSLQGFKQGFQSLHIRNSHHVKIEKTQQP
jgi:hypothetical protein